MKILSIELFGYTRFKLSQINRIKITTTEIIQLILGTNGVGKSSLMEELTPLPANHADFTKDGYKIIELSNNKSHYLLTSKFSPKQEHSFLKDGNELNEGGTITVQKELVKQEFGITPEIHDLIIGNEKFHLMSPARRREWFLKLGETSYEYPIKIFNRLKDKLRDVQGGIKLNKKRLVTETNKVIKQEDIKQYQNDIELLHFIVSNLIRNKTQISSDLDYIQEEKNKILNSIGQISRMVLSTKLHNPLPNEVHSEEELYFHIRRSEESLTSLAKTLKEKVDEVTELERIFLLLNTSSNSDITELQKQYEILITQYEENKKKQKLNLTFDNPDQILNLVISLFPILESVLDEFPANTDRHYSRHTLDNTSRLLFKLTDEKNKLETQYRKTQSHLDHIETHLKEGKVQCPKCEHLFIKDYSEKEHQTVKSILSKTEAEITALVKSIDTTTERLTHIQTYGRKFKEFKQLTESFHQIKPFWDMILKEDYIINQPSMIVIQLSLLEADLKLALNNKAHQEEIKRIEEIIDSVKKTQITNLDSVKARIALLSEEIDRIVSKQKETSDQLEKLTIFQHKTKALQQQYEELQMLDRFITENTNDHYRLYKNDFLNKLIRQFQSVLAIKERTLYESSLQIKLIEDIQQQINILERDEETLKLLTNTLSPSDGMIAEGLFGFIKSFVKQMNQIIKKTWTYNLEIIPCGLSDDGGVDLDYKFPLKVQNSSRPTPDVSKGSSSMKEITDLAFRIVAMKCLGLSQSPLYLDEFAKTLDHQHKLNAVVSIKSLMEQQAFTQLFIISHDFSQYGSFAKTEVTVLDDANILVPGEYNKHVEIS